MTRPVAPHDAAPNRVRGRSLIPILVVMAVSFVAIGAIGFSSLSYWETSCLVCHDSHVGTPSKNVHGSVECSACHRDSGLAGVLSFRVRMISMLPAPSLTPASVRPPIPSSRCLACHGVVLREVVTSYGIRMDHGPSMAAGQQCVDCHGAMFATPAHFGSAISMDDCLRCHLVSSQSNDCLVCHRGKLTLDPSLRNGTFGRTHGLAWESMHGAGDLKTCVSCHSIARCESCHGVVLPHNEMWLGRHGPPAMEDGAGCSQCHSAAFCDDCHKLEMPHPAGYLAAHTRDQDAVEAGVCDTCHEQRSCDRCHARHTHPGLDAERTERLRRKAGLDDS